MFDTKQECKDAAAILTDVIDILSVEDDDSGHSSYICDCISQVCRDNISVHSGQIYSETIKNDLRNWIGKQLDYKFGLATWLEDEHNIKFTNLDHFEMEPEEFHKLQQTRLAWIDWMITELKAKEGRLKK